MTSLILASYRVATLLAAIQLPKASSSLNLFLPSYEVRKLLGLDAELYYVREGVINTYALNFTVPVPENYSHMFFTWQSLVKRPMPYLAQVEFDNREAMSIPRLNISLSGYVPQSLTTFRVSLPCSGRITAVVHVNVHLNVTTHAKSRNVTALTIRRRKTCLQGLPEEWDTPRNESIYQRAEWMSTSLGTLYVAIVCASTFTVLVITITAVFYLRVKRSRTINSLTCRYYSGPGLLGPGQAVSRGLMPTIKSSSYATIASFKKVPLSAQEITSKSTNASSIPSSLHYASSPVSHVYSQPFSPSHSYPYPQLHSFPTTKLTQPSWCSGLFNSSSFNSWKDPRENDSTEKMKQLAVDRWRVVVGDILLEGTFGRIHEGLCHDPYSQAALPVIVKTVTGEASMLQAALVVREGLLFSGLHHSNLQSILGVCMADPHFPLLLYSHLGQTNLKRVDKEFQTKITDTALSRDLFPQDYHCLGDNENRPIKWLAIETLTQRKFLPASDVWSFGVSLWELMTLAQQPYIEVDPFEMAAYLRDGYRLAQPNNCPDDLFGVMAVCWSPCSEDRPTFLRLLSALQDFHSALSKFI